MKIIPKIDSEAALRKYAELKKVPIAKVLHNAAKDVAQAGFNATPKSTVKDGTFYTYIDPKTQQRKYLHNSQVKDKNPEGKQVTRSYFKASGGLAKAQKSAALVKGKIGRAHV